MLVRLITGKFIKETMNTCYCLNENERPIKCGEHCPRTLGLENMLNNLEIIDDEDIEKAQLEFLELLEPYEDQYWI